MGANFNTMSATGDKAAVTSLFDRVQEDDRYENGHSYSGGFGMADGLEFEAAPTFNTDQEADDWLVEHAEKWRAALAVQVAQPEPHWRIGAWCSS